MKRPSFRIKMTKTGVFFVILCLAVGIAGLNTGNNLLYLTFGMMLSFIILSGLLSNNTLSRLTIQPSHPSRIFAWSIVPIRIQLHNRKRFFPSFALSLVPQSPHIETQGASFVLKIPPLDSSWTVNQIRFPKRGYAQLPSYNVQTTYPFGLVQKYHRVPSEGEVLVYPRLLKAETAAALDHQLRGDFLSGHKGGATNPYGIRDYVHGDSVRFIHWKSSAKRNQWMVKEFEDEKRMKVWVELILAPEEQSDPTRLEKAVSTAATILLRFAGKGFEVALLINDQIISSPGSGYMDAYLTELALVQPPKQSHKRQSLTQDTDFRICITDLPQAMMKNNGHLIAQEHLDRM